MSSPFEIFCLQKKKANARHVKLDLRKSDLFLLVIMALKSVIIILGQFCIKHPPQKNEKKTCCCHLGVVVHNLP